MPFTSPYSHYPCTSSPCVRSAQETTVIVTIGRAQRIMPNGFLKFKIRPYESEKQTPGIIWTYKQLRWVLERNRMPDGRHLPRFPCEIGNGLVSELKKFDRANVWLTMLAFQLQKDSHDWEHHSSMIYLWSGMYGVSQRAYYWCNVLVNMSVLHRSRKAIPYHRDLDIRQNSGAFPNYIYKNRPAVTHKALDIKSIVPKSSKVGERLTAARSIQPRRAEG